MGFDATTSWPSQGSANQHICKHAGTPSPSLYGRQRHGSVCSVPDSTRVHTNMLRQGREVDDTRTGSGKSIMSISVREALIVAFAVIVWGPHWIALATGKPVHVRCCVDNASAVSRFTCKHRDITFGQELSRVANWNTEFALRAQQTSW